MQPDRNYSAGDSYRYGFSGKENDNEVKREGNTLDFGSRIYDSRIGRWFSMDPIYKGHISPYNFSANNPVNIVDPDGQDEIHFHYVTIRKTAVLLGKNEQGGPRSYLGFVNVTYKYVTIIEDNKKDQFFVHRQSFVEGYRTPYESQDIQFYPNSGYRTKSGATYSSWWLIPDTKDTDYRSLEKITDDFPELEKFVTAPTFQSANSRSSQKGENKSWWSSFYKSKAFKARAEAERSAVNNIMLGIVVAAGAELFVARVLTSVATTAVETRVLGSYPSYLDLAEKLGAKRFNIPTKAWEKMSETEKWAANVKFLDRGIASGDNFILSNSAFEAKQGTAFYKELQYMYKRGYKPSTDGMSLIKK